MKLSRKFDFLLKFRNENSRGFKNTLKIPESSKLSNPERKIVTH